MKIAMVFPSRDSEKAISSYSNYLTEALNKTGLKADEVTYTAGSYKSFLKIFPKLKNYDIIHIQHEYNLLGGYGIPFFLAYYKLKSLKTKIVTTMHTALSLKEKYIGNFFKNLLRKILYISQNKLINKVSSKVIIHSDFFKDILIKEYGFNKNKIKVFPLGIIENAKITEKNKAKKELGLKGNVFLIMGNLTEDSGADIIINQADKIGKTILVVANPLPVNNRNPERIKNYLDSLKKTIEKKNFEKFVRFDLFDITDQNPIWWKYLSAADFLILAYRGGLGSGMFAHAMATKTPVIASKNPFFKDVAKEYSCIKIVENEKNYPQIIKESLKPENYKKMIKESERYRKENNWGVLAGRYGELYSSF